MNHKVDRRQFLKHSALLMGGVMIGGKSVALPPSPISSLYMPDEGRRHTRTWMAFVAGDHIWSRRQIPEVKRDLALIARTIAQYEPVSMLVSRGDYEEADALLGGRTSHRFPLTLIEFATDDLWLRDTGPTFVTNREGKKIAIDFNFNGWGNKQAHEKDKKVAQFIAQQSGTALQSTDVVLEGGG